MKSLLGLSGLLLLLLGCGSGENGAMPNPYQGASDNFSANSLFTTCNAPLSATLQKTEVANFGKAKLFFDNNTTANTNKLTPDASTKDRCQEIASHFSARAFSENGSNIPGGLVFDIDLPFDDGTKELMLAGKKGSARVADVFLSYVDGALEDSKWQISLRCPKAFLISCRLKQDQETGKNYCDKYIVEFNDQTCTFKQNGLPYTFSDHKSIILDIEGEVRFSGSNADLTITKAAWLGMH